MMARRYGVGALNPPELTVGLITAIAGIGFAML